MQTTEPGGLSRRDMLRAGIGVAAAAGYAIAAEPILAQAIHTDTAGLAAGDVRFPSGGDMIPAYEARPAAGKSPVVVVISEVFGLHEHIKDVCRRFAKAGYYAIGPELFFREGGVSQLQDIQAILKVVNDVPRKQVLQDLAGAADHARHQAAARSDRVGVTGFCWGGGTTMQFAAASRDVGAAVAWYGPVARPYKDDPPRTGFDAARDIACPFLGLFGEQDSSPSPADVRKFEGILKQHNRTVEIEIYPGAGHAFYADYRASYRPEAARAGWARCVAWFDRFLKT